MDIEGRQDSGIGVIVARRDLQIVERHTFIANLKDALLTLFWDLRTCRFSNQPIRWPAFFADDIKIHAMAATKKRKTAKKVATKTRPPKKSSKLIKSIITDKQVNQVKKSVSALAKEINALEQRLNDEGAINVTEVNKIVEAAVKMQQSLAHKEE
jgi:hypothetical protein